MAVTDEHPCRGCSYLSISKELDEDGARTYSCGLYGDGRTRPACRKKWLEPYWDRTAEMREVNSDGGIEW